MRNQRSSKISVWRGGDSIFWRKHDMAEASSDSFLLKAINLTSNFWGVICNKYILNSHIAKLSLPIQRLSSSLFNCLWFVVCLSRIVAYLFISTIRSLRPYKPNIFCEDMILATYQCQHILCCWVEPSLLLSSFKGFHH